MTNPSDPVTISWKQLIAEAKQTLGLSLGGDRSQEAKWIVERVSGYSSTELLLNSNELVSARSVAFFDQLVSRRSGGEPLQYVLGRWSFRQLELIVDQRVLIPRPETEMVAGLAIDHLRTYGRATRAVDLGCGSGAIGLSLAAEVPQADVWLTDVSPDALAVARANLVGLGRTATRVSTVQGSWFEALSPQMLGTFDVIVSNPPYIPESEPLPADVVDWEPHVALFGGIHGDELLNLIVDQAGQWLAPGGALVLEMGPDQTERVAARCNHFGMDATVHQDVAGKPRAVFATASAPATPS
jgi:release factor glutamine methyltransferase